MKVVRKLIVVLSVLLAFAAQAQDQGKQPSGDRHPCLLENTDDHGNAWSHDPVVFSRQDRRIIRSYYRTHSMPSLGRDERGAVPTNWREQLGQDCTLPVRLQKSLQDLPQQLERSLAPLDPAYRRVAIGKDLLIVDTHTQRITDIAHLGPDQ